MGETGCGTAAKLVNQLLVGLHSVAACEGLRFAQAMNITDFKQLAHLLFNSWGDSRILRRVADVIQAAGSRSDLENSGAPIRNLDKDMQIIVDAISSSTATCIDKLQHTKQTFELYNDLVHNQGMAEADMALLFSILGGSISELQRS